MRFDLRFATSVTDPLAGVEFSAQRSEIKREDGSFVFEMNIRAPKNWSQTAVDMLAQKYARKAGVPSETVAVPEAHVPYWLQPQQAAPGATFGPETDAEKIFRRLAGCWTYWGWKGGYFDTEADARNFYADTLFCLATQKFAPNTPQWLNCFSGRQKIITKEFGVAAFAELVDEKLHVWTRQGWKEAEVRCFGPQLLRRVTMAPAFKLSSGSWSAGKTNMRRAVEVTADHRWIMTDGSHSTELKVGDSVLAASVQPDEVSDDYRAGLQHGVIFGDGTAHYQHKTSQLRRYQVNLYGAKTELARHFPTASAPPFLAAAGGVQAAVVSADNLKEFPLPGRSPDYMAGFLDGWLATDGNKKSTNSYRLSTVNPAAGAWLEEFAAYAGWLLVGHSVEVQTKPIVINGKETKRSGPQHCFTLARHDRAWKVTEIVDLEVPEEVFCAVVPEAGEFTLAEGILTGNCGLAWAYGIKSDDTGQFGFDGASRDLPFQLVKDIDQYSRPASGACFIMKLADNLVGPDGITDLIAREARVFRAGSGSGANYSDIRGVNEPLSGGGKSSGLPSFLNPIDHSAGAIKSGGTCLAPHTKVFTDRGIITVKELADAGTPFVCLSYDPPAGRYKAKTATAWLSGHKSVVRVTTDKGAFDVSYDHPMRLADGGYVEAARLLPGQRLFACGVYETKRGYLRVNLRDGRKGYDFFHRLIGRDVLGAAGHQVVHHKDGNKKNNRRENLEVTTQGVHATEHAAALVKAGRHNFLGNTYYKTRRTNPETVSGGTIRVKSAKNKMMETAWKLINAGRDIQTFEKFVTARKSTGRLASITKLDRVIRKNFSSYAGFMAELSANNHTVVAVTEVGAMDVYDVQVECPTTDARTPESGHNFVIWSGDKPTGSGIAVHNSRRAARMVVLDLDHPDISWFINWKADEEKKVAALAAGSKVLKVACEACHAAAAAKNEALLAAKAVEAIAMGVPRGTIDGVVRAARQGLPCPHIPHYDAGYEGKGYQSIEGQNANNSVRITDAFMRAVKDDRNWHLYWRTELRKAKAEGRKPKPCKTLKARALWRQVCLAAWDCADPGVQFHDTINAWHTCPEDGDIRATNPCSEYNWLDDTTCNLASVNVCSFYDVEQDAYDWKGLEDMAELVTTILDITVGMSSYPTASVAENAAKYRTLGMGPMNVGALLMRMGLPYDSDAGRGMAVTVMGLMHLAAMRTSCTMAEKLGTFPRWEPNRRHVQRVMVHHIDYCRGYRPKTANAPEAPATILAAAGTAERLAEAAELTERVLADAGWKMRNAQLTLAAPTGCLVAGSMVITDTGLRRIERLGDPDGPRWQDLQTRVATDDGPRDATKFFVNGVDDVIRVRTASGQTISGTPRHRIKVVDPDGNWVWRSFAELGIGDVIPTMLGGMLGEPRPVSLPACPAPYGPSIRRAVKTPALMTETLAELVGLFHGEGSLHAKGLRFALTAGDADLIEWCLAACRDLFGTDGTVTNHGGYVSVELSSTQVVAWWVSCGFAKERADGKSGKGYVCRIPEAVLDTNDALVYAAYARGLFSGDGTANGGTPSISNKSDGFLDELQTLLAVLGIRSTRSVFTGGISKRPVYRLSIGSRRHTAIFVEKIGFRPKRKAAVLNTADDGDDRSDRIPVPAELMRAVCPVGSPERECLNRYLRRCNSVPRRFAETMAAREPRITRYLSYGYSKVVEAELVGRAPTFDLSVPDNVTYVANGFVSHNTIGLVTDCDTTGIEPDFALVKTKKLAGGGYLKFVNQSVGPALLRLGYSDMQAEEICTFVQQRQTIEGAPHLKDEHLPVFDCANKCGKDGKRFIPAMGHVRMLAAIHPVISGSASKTVNLPPDATLADVTEIYEESHRTGVKCVALYRDGSKLSQPLTSGLSFDAGDPTVAAQTDPTPAPAPQRRKLPNRRNGHTQKVRIGGQKVYIRTGEYEDGTLGEIFVDIDKEGSTLRGVMNTLAKAISIALQHGVPLEEYVDALRYTKFEPHGPVGGHDTIKMASSIVDMIARHLADAYLGDASGTHVQPYPPPGRAPAEDNPATQAVLQGFKSTPCPNCREYKLVQGGKCDVCKNCGHQGGCS